MRTLLDLAAAADAYGRLADADRLVRDTLGAADALEMQAALTAELSTEWPVPTPLRPQPDPLPADAFPYVLRDHALSIAGAVQVAPDMPLILTLAAVSAACADKVEAAVDGAWRREPVNIYAAVVAEPGERKSPSYAPVERPFADWEAEQSERLLANRRAALDVVEVLERALHTAKQAAAKGGSMDDVVSAREAVKGAEAKVPTVPAILAADATPEALVIQMKEQGGRVAVFSPEGGPLRILDGRYSDGAARLEELAQAYDGEPIRVRRVGRDPIDIPRPALTLAVCLQPSVLQTIRNGRSMRGQGLFGRICWVRPASLVGGRVDSSEAPEFVADAERAFGEMLRVLLDWAPKDVERLRFTSDARDVKRAFHHEVEEALAHGPLSDVPDWGGKTVGRAVRIAALLALADRAARGRPLVEPIGQREMEAAVHICRALASHALVVYGELDRNEPLALAEYVLDRARSEGRISERDLFERVKGRSAINHMGDLRAILETLKAHHLVRIDDAPRPDGPGRSGSPIVRVNPKGHVGVRSIRTEAETAPQARQVEGSANTANVKPGAETDSATDFLSALEEALGGAA